MDAKAKVFKTGRSQAIRLPAAFRFTTAEVFVRRDPANGDVILSTRPKQTLNEVFAMLDDAGVPDDFLSDRDLRPAAERESL